MRMKVEYVRETLYFLIINFKPTKTKIYLKPAAAAATAAVVVVVVVVVIAAAAAEEEK